MAQQDIVLRLLTLVALALPAVAILMQVLTEVYRDVDEGPGSSAVSITKAHEEATFKRSRLSLMAFVYGATALLAYLFFDLLVSYLLSQLGGLIEVFILRPLFRAGVNPELILFLFGGLFALTKGVLLIIGLGFTLLALYHLALSISSIKGEEFGISDVFDL